MLHHSVIHHSVHVWVMFGVLLGGLCLATVILRAACALFNKLAPAPAGPSNDEGHPDAIKLDSPQAFVIVLASVIVEALVSFLVTRVLHWAGVRASSEPLGILPVAHAIGFPVSILVIAAMVPTKFSKGLLVALLYLLIWAAVAGVILALFAVFLPPHPEWD
jgi:hypothetical protein